MNDKFYPELTRRLRQESITTGPVEKDRLSVLVNGQAAIIVSAYGIPCVTPAGVELPNGAQLHAAVSNISAQVYEYTEAMATAPWLEADGLHEDFRLLAEYNGVVLAGQELERDQGYQFATWRRSPDRTAMGSGNYYPNGYEAAKLDFACRSGLVQASRQFTDEQLTELYRCIHETLDSSYPMTEERMKLLMGAVEQIESSVDDLDERVELSNQRELEAAQGQANEPALEF